MEMAEDTSDGSSTEDSRLGLVLRAVFAAARGRTLRTSLRELEALRMAETAWKVRRRRRQKVVQKNGSVAKSITSAAGRY
jgi:hypothetical protein